VPGKPHNVTDTVREVLEYHRISKHRFDGYAPGPHGLDWANQPDPFRRYPGTQLMPLRLAAVRADGVGEAGFDAALTAPGLESCAVDIDSVSQLFQDSLGLSAWKSYQGSRWALRMNPSSGNLHPTDGYLISGPVDGLGKIASIAHYTPCDHVLEIRAELPRDRWEALKRWGGDADFFVALSSLHWREAWKYGERAFRYCNHDVGHAVAALAVAAAGLGWRVRLLDAAGSESLQELLGLAEQRRRPDREIAECILGFYAGAQSGGASGEFPSLGDVRWYGEASGTSPEYVEWSWVRRMAEITAKPAGLQLARDEAATTGRPGSVRPNDPPLRRIVHQRRSAVEMDGVGTVGAAAFYRLLASLLPRSGRVPFDGLGWEPNVHLALFVHRVDGIEPGLYILIRNPGHESELRGLLSSDFSWRCPAGCPNDLPLYQLAVGDARRAAATLSCHQSIASDGCFSIGMITRFCSVLESGGAWVYPRLYWECGLIGQVLYLEAEAAGLRGTGIGCFFDDAVHKVLGIESDHYQSLYHFTVGHPLDDERLSTLPPYSDKVRAERRSGTEPTLRR
jgi:SagB-type dehydrogenase family enzyme